MNDIKQLQNNFTTPEQSKRLLELGVPSDSADCYYTSYGAITVIPDGGYDDKRIFLQEVGCTLCWSVGQLLYIFDKCYIGEYHDSLILSMWMDIDSIISALSHKECIDFLKLED